MSLADLGMEFTGSFLENDGILEYVEHFRDGTTANYELTNVFPFTSIADLKRMIWIDVGGSASYTPNFVFVAYEKDGKYVPMDFHWPTESRLPAELPDPLTNQEPLPELVDSAGNRSGTATFHMYATIEDSFRSNQIKQPTLHIWRLSEILGPDRNAINIQLIDGFIRLYFPWISELRIEDAYVENSDSESESKDEYYKICKSYITSRQEQLTRLEEALKKHGSKMGELYCRAIEKLKIRIPTIIPKPESLEILFYELKLSQELPFIRYFSDRGDQEPILRYLKNAYIPADAMTAWLKEPVSKKEQLILGKILIRGNRIAAGSAFDVLFFKDNTARVEIQSPRKDHLFLGSLIEEGLVGLQKFVTSNSFEQIEPPTASLKLIELHGKFVWEHPLVSSPRPSIEEIKERLRNYSYIFELEKGEPGVINLRYTALTNYESDNNITGYISRLAALEFSEQELSLKETTIFFTEKIQRRFSKSPKEALAIFQNFLENKGKQETVAQGKGEEAVPLHNDGVIITIRNNHPSYEIEIANLLSPGAGENLRRIMTGLAIVLLEKTEVKSETPTVLQAVASIKKEDATLSLAVDSSDAQTRAASATASATVDAGNLDFLNFLEGEGDEEFEEEAGGQEQGEVGEEAGAAIGSVPAEVVSEAAPVILASRAPVESPEAAPTASTSDEVQKDVSKFYITKLKQLDSDLFGYQDKRAGKSKGYSSACQTSNGDMPHSLSQSQYARIKEIYKDKITFIEGPKPKGWKLNDKPPMGYGPKVTWDLDSNFSPPRPVWVTLRTGSEIKRNWYMCSLYWCLRDDIPLIESEFEAKHECPQCGGKKITGSSPSPGETVLERKTENGFKKYIGFQSKSKHPDNYPLPCCGIKAKEDKLVDTTRSYDKVSIQPEQEPEQLQPSQLAAQEEEKARQTRGVVPLVEINKILSSLPSKYIKSVGKYPLGPGELGVVPPQIDSLFGQDSTKAIKKSGPQQMLSRDQMVFIRFGLQNTEQPGNRFLSMLGFWMGTFNLNDVISRMTTPAFVHAFEDANYGTLVHEFARPDLPAEPIGDSFRKFIEANGYAQNEGSNRANLVRLFYSYQNFMNYVRDANTPKDIRYFEHLLMMPGALLTRGILLLRILRDNDSDDWAVQCPAFGIPSTNDKPTPVFVIHDSKYSIWEPLILYAGTDKAITTFDSTDLYGKLGQSSSAAIHKWILEIKKKGVGCGRLQTPPYTWSPASPTEAASIPTISDILKHCRSTSVEPRGIVRERSNRFVGFIFENKENRRFFVPARDDGTSTHQWPRFYESKALLPAPSLSEIQTFYNDNKFSNLNGLQIIKILISSKEQPAKYVAILLKSGVILPIDPTQDSAGLDVQPVTDFPWDLDEQLLPLPARPITTEIESEEGFINETYQYLRLILANHFKRDAEGARVLIQLKALRDARNLPLYERRKRVDTILYSVVYQFIKETPYTTTLKELPRIRKNIGSPNMKLEDCPPGIASWSDGRCMLHVPSTANITARLTDEILRNPWAFAEIDTKQVSRVRPLSGTVETATEIITTDTFSIDSQVGKIHKTKYTQGLQFAEEQPTTMDILKAVLGGQIDESSSLVKSMTRLEGEAYHLDLPLSFKDRYKKFSVVANAQADRLKLGLVYLFSILQQKQNPTIESIYAQVKNKQEKLRVPADIIAGGWRSSPYDFYALALVANCRLALITTSVTGTVVINSYFNPMGTNKPDIILLWGEGPDLVIDLEGHATHHVNTLPPDLSKQMEQMDRNETSIKKIDQLQVPIESLGSVVVAEPLAPTAPLEEQVASETVSIAPPSQVDEPVALQVAEERPVESNTVSIASPSQVDAEERPFVNEVALPPPTESLVVPPPEAVAPAELPDEGFSIQEPEIPAPAPPVEESQQEPAVAFAGVVNDTEGEGEGEAEEETEGEGKEAEAEKAEEEGAEEEEAEAEEEEAEESKNEPVKIYLPESKNEVEGEEAPAQEAQEEAPAQEAQEEAPAQEAQEEAPAQEEQEEAPAQEEQEEAEEWNEEVNQIQAAQPTLPQQPPSEQQISRPPPPAS